jgi:phage gp36-like protein
MSYATPDDLKEIGLPPEALEELTDPDIQAQLTADAGIMDFYIGAQYTLPILAPYPAGLVRINVCLATYHILMRRGFNPEGPDRLYAENFKSCMALLEDIKNGIVPIPGIEDSTPTVNEGAPQVATQPLRGWGDVYTGMGSCGDW